MGQNGQFQNVPSFWSFVIHILFASITNQNKIKIYCQFLPDTSFFVLVFCCIETVDKQQKFQFSDTIALSIPTSFYL